jgi:hypothetical protein
MTVARPMLDAFPRTLSLDVDLLGRTIDALGDCAQACTACADACLAEEDVAAMVLCVRTDLDCADVCQATLRVLSRQHERDVTVTRALVETARAASRRCADECERHAAHHGHCRLCAEACRRCERACDELLAAMG